LFRPALLVSLFALIATGCRSRSPAHGRQVIVIGVDGMDPVFVERHWAELPNLARLRDQGGYSHLATTDPPQSPVAWSTFATGLDPDRHGIFDFVERDPGTMQPFLSMAESRPPRFALPLGPYELPLSRSRVVSLRKGKTFWQLMEDRGIATTIIHLPANYPPVDSGEALAGMGTPDLRGTQGTFSFYTDDPGVTPGPVSGGVIARAEVVNGHAELRIEGPPNPLRRDHAYAPVKLNVDVDPDQPIARLALGNDVAIVREGEWSDWMPAEFPLIPHVVRTRGMFRVYARRLHPGFELYVSPVNVDPASPDLPISVPHHFSRDIAQRTGRYATLGIPEDTSALRQGIFNLSEFLAESRRILNEEQKLLDDSLHRFREGLLFFYFSSVDQNSHVLFGRHDDDLLYFYRGVDRAIGKVINQKPGAQVMVMSDHGFASFNRAVNLNTWLYDQGLLSLKSSPATSDKTLDDIDWARTKLYALGLNGLYVNLAGREREGVVHAGAEYEALVHQMRKRLLALRDPITGAQTIETVSPGVSQGPDLIVGYARGYRASWETGTGGLAMPVFEDNDDAWIADHCINPADVPGVLFSTRKIRLNNPSLKDLPVSLLALFELQPGTGMTGRSVY
jgi:predicted AlkP superfamily phosphohydrolase/phosphomutase